ncbi:MAG TPA: THxN family PEP-CTERM protein [Pedomonas sp.]|uniref:THxN family PEP-CTERM protein n=1 Tax=Pedomonas sp. TaxID=2976421 RepID=UPI002F3F5C28
MKPIRSALMGTAISLAAIGGAAPANAALVENWIVSIANSWSDTEFTSSGLGSFVPEDPFGVFDTLPDGSDPRNLSYDVISWGTPRTDAGRSFLGVDETVSIAGLRTNDTAGVVGTSFYHGNYRQASSTGENPAERWLDSATLNLRITLSPEGDDARSQVFDHSIPIDFMETRNTANLANCAGGSWPAETAACPDSLTTTTEAASFSFVLDDFRYFLTFLFDPENSQNVLRADLGDDTATLWTAEGARSRLSTRLAITNQPLIGPSPVPEPNSIALAAAGFGLLGLARLWRRRHT